jgi:HAE1 family hydrophobic/amphiphilic exporter-1
MLRSVIQRPIAISMCFLALVLIGALSYKRIPVDLLPSIVYPRLTIVTTYEDVPATDLERLVTQPIEQVVTALADVRRVDSRTREGVSIITVEYEWGTEMDFANLHLREAVDRVAFRRDFPETADRPVILRWDPTSRPISILVLTGTDRLEELTEFATEVVKPAMEQVDGISQAEVVGGTEREIRVEPDPRKLAIYGVSIADMRTALAQSNVSFPGGKIRQGPLHLSLRIAGEFEAVDEIGKTEIPRAGRPSIRVSDVARVLDTTREPEGATLLGGEPVVSMLIYKEPEANTIQVATEVDRALEVLESEASTFSYRFVYRDAEFVRASFEGLLQSLVVGAFLAFLVLFLFLNDTRSPVVVGISIPVSVMITFGLLHFGKVKLNLMSLGGLSLAAGMLVDNAIVVLENVNRHIRESLARRAAGAADPDASGDAFAPADERRLVADAAERGTREVGRAVVAATLTTIAVFFPVVYVPGIAGAFFRDQALTVTFSLAVSVAAALILQPMLSARVLRTEGLEPRGVFKLFSKGIARLYDAYHRLLARAVVRPVPMLVGLAVALVAAGLVTTRLDRHFLPERSSGDLRLDIELPAGTPLEETTAFVTELSEWIDEGSEVKAVFAQVGRTEQTLAAMQDYASPATARVRVVFGPTRGAYRAGQELIAELEERLARVPGLTFAFHEEGIGLGELLSQGGAPFSLGVIAEEPETAVAVAESLAARFRHVEGLRDVEVDRVMGTSNVVVRLDRETIFRHGLVPDDVADELRNRVAGVEATTFNEVEQRIDIAVRLPRDERRDLGRSLDTPIRTPTGETVPLRSLLVIGEERPVRELVRRNQRRMVSVSANVDGRRLDDIWGDAMAAAEAAKVPPGVRLVRGGESEAMRESFTSLGWAMVLAVLLVYMILAAQFESFLDPLLIASVIPIGVAGAALTIGITGTSINILSMIGMLALLGIAVNDAIVKVDTIRRLRAEGMPGHDAVMEASRLRFRPILMTSATTILAMLPMAIGLGSGEQLQRPLALTIIGGLALTTCLTLLYTPILYEVAHRIRPRGVDTDTGDPDDADASHAVDPTEAPA